MTSLWILAILFSASRLNRADKCNLFLSLWCSSGETADLCSVLQQCVDWNTEDVGAGPVNFTLYYESLCNSCRAMIASQIYPTYITLGESVMNLTLVPYGNAKEKKTIFGHWKFECQHGKEECVGNVIESCALNMEKNKTKSFLFIHCMENIAEYPKAAKKCAPKFNIDYDKLMACANSDQGAQLEHNMAVVTGGLNPPHTYVPWVTLNGVHTETINDKAAKNLMSLICETYRGPKPDACKKYEKVKPKQNSSTARRAKELL